MADSNITKRALANALKELMAEMPFEKINIAQICDRCDMNRKSFYYHFKDKYDLVNWIFDTEIIELTQKHTIDLSSFDLSFENRWESIDVICRYFYENRQFYRKVLKIKGQNSFSDHFHAFIHPLIRARIKSIAPAEDIPDMIFDFVTDGITCSLERWLLDKNCLPADEFIANLLLLIKLLFLGVSKHFEADPQWKEFLS